MAKGAVGAVVAASETTWSSTILSPGLKLGHVGSLRGRTVGHVGPGLVLVRPGARASGSPHLPGWVPGVRPHQVVGPPATGVRSVEYGLLGLADTLARATKGVQPAGGASHPSWGVPRSSRTSAGQGAVRRAVPGGHKRDGVRVGLLTPKAAGDSSSWTPGQARPCGARQHLSFRVIPAAHNCPAASSKATAMQASPRLIVFSIMTGFLELSAPEKWECADSNS